MSRCRESGAAVPPPVPRFDARRWQAWREDSGDGARCCFSESARGKRRRVRQLAHRCSQRNARLVSRRR